jgi:O-acetyl-ADP-ribose deacetylase (regulator of RNase III)
MISLTQGNLLDADAEALVNTVNTKGIMGKGIALMFKDRFPANFDAYADACKRNEVRIGEMFVTKNEELFGPTWVINFPTKTNWRVNTRLEWIKEGLNDLLRVIEQNQIRSIAIPPLGCGNGGLDWSSVRPVILAALEQVEGLNAIVYEPTDTYQNVSKRTGVEKLTPARALVAEMVRRYCLLGIDCSILEVQKLAWFIERGVKCMQVEDPLQLEFRANKYGPYSHRLSKLLDSLDGSYLRCEKRLADAGPFDLIWFNEAKKDVVNAYLSSGEAKIYAGVLEWASCTIDGFESPLGMELLATVDWLLEREGVEPTVAGIKKGLSNWAGGVEAGRRKLSILDDRLIGIALDQLTSATHNVHAAESHN